MTDFHFGISRRKSGRCNGLISLLALLMFAVFVCPSVDAQTRSADPRPDRWTYELGPHAWFAGVKGKIAVGDSEVDIDYSHKYFVNSATFFDVGVSVRFRAWRGKKAFEADFNYLQEQGSSGRLDDRYVRVDFKQFMADVRWRYAVNEDRPRVSIIGGVRTFVLQPDVRIGSLSSSTKGRAWVNFIVGVGVRSKLLKNLHLVAQMDGGGLKSSSTTWGFWAGLDYRFWTDVTLRAGYRRIDVDHTTGSGVDRFVYDMRTDGLVLGVSVEL